MTIGGIPASRRVREAGFSLTEMLVALFILSIIAASSTALMSRSVSLQRDFETDAGREGQFQRAHALIRDDLTTMTRTVVQPADIRVPPHVFLGGEGRSDGPFLSLARSAVVPGAASAAAGRESAVVFVREGDSIVRRVWLSTSPEQSEADFSRVLFSGVTDFRVEYGGDGGDWVREWSAALPEADLPRRLRMRVTFRDGRRYEIQFMAGATS